MAIDHVRFELKISDGGEALTGDPAEQVALILERVAGKVREGSTDYHPERDVNGHRVGGWVLTITERDDDGE